MYSSKQERNVLAVLEQAGYCANKKLTDTLQGSVWCSKHRQTMQDVIIKVTSRKLHKDSMIIYDGKKYNVDENIIKEKEILKYLTQNRDKEKEKEKEKLLNNNNNNNNNQNSKNNNNDHCHIVEYRDFFKSNSNYYLTMSHGGYMLFDFVVRVHSYIDSGKLDIAEWHRLIKVIFRQILCAVEYIHTQNVCHFDISLENLLISEVEVVLGHDGKIKFCLDNVHVKLCDFGLSEQFISDNFMSTKCCGKPNYKSPECTSKKSFDARMNDTWCTGVCLFMLLIGGNMVNVASSSDESFVKIMNGDMDKLLTEWKRIQYVDASILNLFSQIFVLEPKRATIQQIKQHHWLR